MKARCPQGHLMSGANVYLWRRARHCRACRRERSRLKAEECRSPYRDPAFARLRDALRGAA